MRWLLWPMPWLLCCLWFPSCGGSPQTVGWRIGFCLILPTRPPSQMAGGDLVFFVVWAAFMTVALPLFQWFEAVCLMNGSRSLGSRETGLQKASRSCGLKRTRCTWRLSGRRWGLFLGLGLVASLEDSPDAEELKRNVASVEVMRNKGCHAFPLAA